MSDRLPCVVPGCKRTLARTAYGVEPEDDVCICSRHWRGVRPESKAVYRRLRRNARHAVDDLERDLFALRKARIWRALVRQAIEVAAGIG